MEAEPADDGAQRSLFIAEPRVQNALRRFFARRAPRSDVDNLVQTTLADALAAKRAPADPAEWDLWVYGIARHKLADHFRKRRNETSLDDDDAAPAESAHQEARDLLKWAEQELPSGQHARTTLEVLLEEADGESLESLARARALPPARLRQRVVRLREHFRSRWALYLTVLGVFGAVAALAVRQLLLSCCAPPPEIAEEIRRPVPPAIQEGRELRRLAFEKCRAGAAEECLKGLDAAGVLDSAGDTANEVVEERAAARRAIDTRAPAPVPSTRVAPPPTALPVPSTRVAPPPTALPVPTASPSPAPRPRPRKATPLPTGMSGSTLPAAPRPRSGISSE